MTMVLGYQFKEGAIMIADSRATWEMGKRGNIPQDSLQKILPLGPRVALGYAGDVKTATLIAAVIRGKVKKDPRILAPRKLATEITRIAKFFYSRRKSPTSLILGCVSSNGQPELWEYNSPNFDPVEITGFSVIGSGDVVKVFLEQIAEKLEKESSLKKKADILYAGLGSELGKTGAYGVGGMFQVLLLESRGIAPLRYGFVDVNPDAPPAAKSIEMQKGVWVQSDLVKGKSEKLVEPSLLLKTSPKKIVFHEFEVPPGEKAATWHCTYFLTCLEVRTSVGETEFTNPMSSLSKHERPISADVKAAIGIWGSPGDHELQLKLIKGGQEKIIHKEIIHIEYLPEEIDVVANVNVAAEEPGPAILECSVAGQVISRRALFFGLVGMPPPRLDPQFFIELAMRRLQSEMRDCSDEIIEQSGKAELVYLSLCQNVVHEDNRILLEGQFTTAYWNKYPLPLRATMASAFRMPKGTHQVKVLLVNAASRKTTIVDTATVTASSSFMIQPVQGEMIFMIPEPGLYFVNVLVDDIRIGSLLIAAETEEPKYSYTLLPEQVAEVKSGQLMLLSKRSQQAPDTK